MFSFSRWKILPLALMYMLVLSMDTWIATIQICEFLDAMLILVLW